jgi:hypothetical protein
LAHGSEPAALGDPAQGLLRPSRRTRLLTGDEGFRSEAEGLNSRTGNGSTRLVAGLEKGLLVMILGAVVGMSVSQAARIARRGVTTYSVVVLGVAILLLLLGAILARRRDRLEKSGSESPG